MTGELADNGGPVQTIAIRPDSVARDAGDAGLLPPDIGDLDGDNDFAEDLPVDARGFQRVARRSSISALSNRRPRRPTTSTATGAATCCGATMPVRWCCGRWMACTC